MSTDTARPLTLITGASRGIGAATARLLARQGHDLALNYRHDAAAAEAVAQDVRRLGRRALTVQADVADPAQVEAMFRQVDEALGRVTGLVNNAGIVAPATSLDGITPERLRRMFEAIVVQRASIWHITTHNQLLDQPAFQAITIDLAAGIHHIFVNGMRRI